MQRRNLWLKQSLNHKLKKAERLYIQEASLYICPVFQLFHRNLLLVAVGNTIVDGLDGFAI